MNKRIYVVSGFSGVGKDTVLEKVTNIEKCVMKDNSTLWYSRSDTTRAPRNDADATAVKLWSILHGLPASGDMFNTLKFIDAINEYIK